MYSHSLFLIALLGYPHFIDEKIEGHRGLNKTPNKSTFKYLCVQDFPFMESGSHSVLSNHPTAYLPPPHALP